MKNSKKEVERELNKLFENFDTTCSIKVSFILSKLNLSFLTNQINYQGIKFTTESILKLYIWRKVKGIHKHYQVQRYFQDNKEEAFQLGFSNDENNNIQIPKKTTFNEFFLMKVSGNIIKTLDKISELILATTTRKKILLDIDLVQRTIKKKKDHKREIRETIKLVKKLIYPQIDIKIKENGKFTTKDLLNVLVHIAYSHDFTNNGSNTFQELYPEIKAPSGDLMLYHFSKFKSTKQIKKMFISIFDVIFNFAKQNYKFLNSRKVNIAYDIHKIPYYGDKNDPFVIEGKPERGTSHFYQFLTASIVVNGQRFAIDAIPIFKTDILQELLDKSLERVKKKIKIDKAYFDRGFDKPKIINTIKKHNIKFIMPKIRSKTVKAWMKKSQGVKAREIKNFEIGQEEKAIVNLYLVDDKDGIKRAFITNFHVPVQLSHYLFLWYSKRWGIETGYRNLDHDFKARTTSKNYHIRLFYFLFSVALYNLWVLVNLVVSLAIYSRLSEKPIITAKLFAVILYKVVYEDPPT